MYPIVVIQTPPAGVALDRLARLERLYDGPIPAPLRRWALSGMPPAPPRLQADPGTPVYAGGAAVLNDARRATTNRCRARAPVRASPPDRTQEGPIGR